MESLGIYFIGINQHNKIIYVYKDIQSQSTYLNTLIKTRNAKVTRRCIFDVKKFTFIRKISYRNCLLQK